MKALFRILRRSGWPGVNIALVLLLLLSAVGVILSSHWCRNLYSDLQQLESRRWNMQEQWGRLLLEHSTWAAHHRVERLARTELDMHRPQAAQLTVLDSAAPTQTQQATP